MNRLSLQKKIMTYYLTFLLFIFVLFLILFNTALKIYASKIVTSEITTIQKLVQESISGNSVSNRLSLERQIREKNNTVKVMFLDEDMNYIPPEIYYRDFLNSYLKDEKNPQDKKNSLMDESKNLNFIEGLSQYSESAVKLAEYIRDNKVEFTPDKPKRIVAGGENYFAQMVPFTFDKQNYLIAYISLDNFERLLRGVIVIFILSVIPSFLLASYLVSYFTRHITVPLSKLIFLSKKLGNGNFEGEDFNIKQPELKELNDSLNETARSLKEYDENQKIFFQNVSHELRTPLTSIKGYAEGMKYKLFTSEEASEVILEESEKLEELVEDILYLSRLEANESFIEEKTQLYLSDLIHEVVNKVRNKAVVLRREINIEIKQDTLISIHLEELTRGLINILVNALKYSKKTVTILGSFDGENITIKVTDDGIGIEEEVLKDVFNRFRKGKKGSHGIGLSITKAAILKHGGEVYAHNTENGAEFTMIIPYENIRPEVEEDNKNLRNNIEED